MDYRSAHEEVVITVNKKAPGHGPSQSLHSTNLKKMANIMVYDTKVKTAEDLLVQQRKEHMKELRAIRNYLNDMKTGARIKKEQYQRQVGTKVSGK